MIKDAVEILRAGGLVAFPTETVYGLGADARSSDAVNRIFRAKGRPSTNPLIVHVSGVAMAKLYASEWPDAARRLAQAFWPGPLTLVLPRFKTIAPEVSAGLNTVGLRMPKHPLAIELIRAFDGPVAAPSANRSTHISPTTADHVREEFGETIDLILDGGPCTIGIESTVLDLTRMPCPVMLRPGGITQAQLEKVIGPVDATPVFTEVNTPAVAPGQQLVHYAPQTPAVRFDRLPAASLDALDVAIIAHSKDKTLRRRSPRRIEMPNEPKAYAHHLYAVLREADHLNARAIHIEMPPDAPAWSAVRDRLTRATKPGVRDQAVDERR